MNHAVKPAPLHLPKPIPGTERGRVAEAETLLQQIQPEDVCRLTTWERETLDSIKQGMAVTRIRLKELRTTIERLYPQK